MIYFVLGFLILGVLLFVAPRFWYWFKHQSPRKKMGVVLGLIMFFRQIPFSIISKLFTFIMKFLK